MEARPDHRRALIERHHRPDHVGSRAHEALDLAYLRLGGGCTLHDDVALHPAVRQDPHPARHAVRERHDLVVVDARQPVDGLGQAKERGEDRGREDRPLACLDHDREDVRLAEVPVVAVVDLDEGMALRQEIRGPELERKAKGRGAERG